MKLGVDKPSKMCYNVVTTKERKGIDTMNCLKCFNYWQTDIDETKCDQCGCDTPKESEEKGNGEKASDLC